MTAPSLSAYANGISQVSGDQLNTFNQWCVTVSQLRGFAPNPAVPNLLVYLEGYSAAADGGQGFFYWNTVTGTDDNGVTTIVPNGSTAGCWSRIPQSPIFNSNIYQATPANPTGTSNTSLTMMGLAGSITPKYTGTICLIVSGFIANSGTGGASVELYIGTGTAPANGASLTGTQVGQVKTINPTVAATDYPFASQGIVVSLTIGTTYWLDAALAANTTGTASLGDLSVTAFEIK